MTLTSGSTPPLHRRFNESESLRQIRDRYIGLRRIAAQVAILQNDDAFLERCAGYYRSGYKD